jgi:hypothetical protein
MAYELITNHATTRTLVGMWMYGEAGAEIPSGTRFRVPSGPIVETLAAATIAESALAFAFLIRASGSGADTFTFRINDTTVTVEYVSGLWSAAMRDGINESVEPVTARVVSSGVVIEADDPAVPFSLEYSANIETEENGLGVYTIARAQEYGELEIAASTVTQIVDAVTDLNNVENREAGDTGLIGRAVRLLVRQFEGATRLEDLVNSGATLTQELAQAAWDTYTLRWIDTAFGAQLDGLGDILGELRFGRDDETYRLWLRFRIFINTSQGRPEDLIEVCRFVSNEGRAGGRVKYWENWPASVQLFTDGAFIPGMRDPYYDAILEFDDTALMELSDGSNLLINPGRPEHFNTLVDLLKSVSPVATGILPVGYSLGNFPFSVAGDLLPVDFSLDDGALLELDDGDTLAINPGIAPEGDGGGFAEIVPVGFALDDGALLELDSGDTLAVIDADDPAFDTTDSGVLIEVIQG